MTRIWQTFGHFITVVILLFMASPVLAQNMDTREAVLHLLNRATFGATEEEVQRVQKMGWEAWLDQQLHPERIGKSVALETQLNQYPMLGLPPFHLVQEYGFKMGKQNQDLKQNDPEKFKEMQESRHDLAMQMIDAAVQRAVLSPAQLQEVMARFWFNHFNVFAEKGPDKYLTYDYEQTAIRPHVFGQFRDLLGATAHHAAMLVYLDNVLNTAPDSPGAKGKQNGINENYARELMELHTLGAEGGYTQQDVVALAHILTGWGMGRDKESGERMVFVFDPRRHDTGDKLFLGHVIHGGAGMDGMREGEEALDILARHPSTAKHISLQLAQAFVSDNPPQSLVNKMAVSFRNSDGNMRAVLQTMFHAPEFWDEKNFRSKFKPPFRFIASALRAGNITLDDDRIVLGNLRNLGELPYHCLTPNGYPASNNYWMNSDALLKRIELARGLTGKAKENVDPNKILGSLGNALHDETMQTLKATPPKLQPVVAFSSPEFLYY